MECKVINWYKLIVMLNLNELIFWKIHILAGQYQWLDLLIEFFAVYSGYVLIGVVLCLVIFRSSPRKRLMFLEAVASAILSRLVITEIIRAFYHHPRPFAAGYCWRHRSWYSQCYHCPPLCQEVIWQSYLISTTFCLEVRPKTILTLDGAMSK